MRIKLGRRLIRSTRSKFGLYSAAITGNTVVRVKSVGLYFEGICDRSRTQSEVIPKIRDYIRSGRQISFPLVIQSYISKAPSLKEWSGGAKREPDQKSRKLEFLIDDHFRVTKLTDNGTIIQ